MDMVRLCLWMSLLLQLPPMLQKGTNVTCCHEK